MNDQHHALVTLPFFYAITKIIRLVLLEEKPLCVVRLVKKYWYHLWVKCGVVEY
jgi:hypothetical protein